MDKPQTLKGFRDFLPSESIARSYLIEKMKTVFEKFGFDPLETPALEYAETLLGKYGDEADKLLYIFEDRGKRKVGMRYDQTVPTARVVAQYQDIAKPFKRYQIQPVWRAENTQKGRYREFLQCDADIIGDNFAPTADAEILTLFWNIYYELGFKSFQVVVNSRKLLKKIVDKAISDSFGNENTTKIQDYINFKIYRIIDKLEKVGEEKVKEELTSVLKDEGFPQININIFMDSIKSFNFNSYKDLKEIDQNLYYSLQMAIENFKIPEKSIVINPLMVRGLDYYTGLIFEGIDKNYQSSLGGGGRYDNLIGQFSGNTVTAVGFAIGFDRTLDTAKSLGLIPNNKTKTRVLIAVIEDWKEVFPTSLNLVTQLRDLGINTELYLNPQEKIKKQLKYANKKGISYVIIVGPEEIKKNVVKLKNMKTGEQRELNQEDLVKFLISNS